MNIVQIKELSKSYGYGRGELKVLQDINLDIEEGSIVSIVGPSGAGKSTLLNVIGCLDGFQNGTLAINGEDVSRQGVEQLAQFRNKNIGFIFQLHNLLPEFNALENVMLPLMIRRYSKRKARSEALAAIERFGLLDRIDHKPGEMSGGECQRIAVARAIVGKPALILADEPTGSLDSDNSRRLTDVLFELGKEQGSTVIIVTHDHSIAERTERTITLVDGAIVDDNRRTTGEQHEN